MNKLQNDFRKRSIAVLEDLTKRAETQAIPSPAFLREAFRILHTIKGTSQTFGFLNASKIAHELENIISEESQNINKSLFEGILLLIKSLENERNSIDFKSSFENHDSSKKQTETDDFIPEIFKDFSANEKKSIVSAKKLGKNILFINAGFDLADFTGKLKDLQKKLLENGEIIAVLPNPEFAEQGKIGFRICLASFESENKIKEIAENFETETVSFEVSPNININEVFKELKRYCRTLAEQSKKSVEIIISVEKINLNSEKSNLIFDICLHLLRNAIDHGIETVEERKAKGKLQKAKIEIMLEHKNQRLKLSVTDDGRGIDTEKIRAKAIEKRLISANKTLTENELLDLIFLHEFSTAESVSEISGRGIGLDAVKKMVENAEGTISVKSRREFGTTFEVFLHDDR